MLSRAGRLVLAKSVISAFPIFYMSVYKLPQWLINIIDKKRRQFIWDKTGDRMSIFPLMAWQKVCLLKNLGGFGVSNLTIQNTALLLRWLWKLYHNESSLWAEVATAIYAPKAPGPPILWKKEGSTFWKDLYSLKSIFQLSTTWVPGNGNAISLWFDNWGIGHLNFISPQRNHNPHMRRLTLTEAVNTASRCFPRPLTLAAHRAQQGMQHLQLSRHRDQIVWKWHPSGIYTASSIYNTLVTAAKLGTSSAFVWKVHVPPSVQLFGVLLLQNKILTQDVLIRRNVQVQLGCIMCNTTILETSLHLFRECPLAISIWDKIGRSCRFNFLHYSPNHDLLQFFQDVSAAPATVSRSTRWEIMLMTVWHIWKERNRRVFSGEFKVQNQLLEEILVFINQSVRAEQRIRRT